MSNTLTKKVNQVTNMGTLMQAIFADLAAVIRVAQAGLDWNPLGDCTAAVQCGRNMPVMLYNSTGAVLYVKFGAQNVTAPTTAANGIPIAAGEKFVASSGVNSWVIASAVGIFAYNCDIL